MNHMHKTDPVSISRAMARLVIETLEEKKAEDIRVIDIGAVSSLGDYFILASGMNRAQIQTMSDEIEKAMAGAGHHPRHVEGYEKANWVLLDYNDVIIHLFDRENRLFFNLERIWRDGKEVEASTLK